ncbi:MAG: hypothetical protein R2698_14130 [Microthrixaceae bacterium]
MSAPLFVPTSPTASPSYTSPARTRGPWTADRPGDLPGPQPEGDGLGSPGPDQGYALNLADLIVDDLRLAAGEHPADAVAAVAAVANKRASIFGRAPILDDARAAATVLGFDHEPVDGEEGDRRTAMLSEVHVAHAYTRLRSIVDMVPASTLDRPAAEITRGHAVVSW